MQLIKINCSELENKGGLYLDDCQISQKKLSLEEIFKTFTGI